MSDSKHPADNMSGADDPRLEDSIIQDSTDEDYGTSTDLPSSLTMGMS